jgi:WD40 repeat protein
LQDLLGTKIKKNNRINGLILELYKPKPTLGLDNAFFTKYDIVVGARWFCAISTDPREEDDKSGTSVLDLQTLEPACEHTIKRNFDAIKVSPRADLMLGFPATSGIDMSQGVVYSFKTGKIAGRLPFEDTVNSWCFSSDGKLIIASPKYHIYILDSNTLCVKKDWSIDSSVVRNLASSADGRFVAFTANTLSGNTNTEIKIWDTEQEKKHCEFTEGLEKRIHCLLFSPDSRYLAYAVSDGEVKICHLYDKAEPYILQAGNRPNNSALLAFSPDSKLLATYYAEYMYNNDSVMHVWNYKKNKIKKTYNNGGYRYINALGFSPDGKRLACIKGFTETHCKDLFIYDLVPQQLKNLSLKPLILLWYLAMQENANKHISIPKEYSKAFQALPEEIRNHFFSATS